MSTPADLTFYGDGRDPSGKRRPDSPAVPEPYVAPGELVRAVNLAIYLRRPLLLEGEAGCGKTRLASAVAYELNLPFHTWPVRSTSKAQEGLYTYDAILRLHDVQILRREGSGDAPAGTEGRDPRRATDYRRFGPLGLAFQSPEAPAVVLIDEIDKADIDFPNDLLTVLDEPWSFSILETGEKVTASSERKPIVIITSNKEKGNLPAPFLRRCLYYYVEFPRDPADLEKIVAAHYARRVGKPDGTQVKKAARRFLLERERPDLYKKPGTSEFLDWMEALRGFGPSPYPAEELDDAKKPPPYPEVLFKHRADWQRYSAAS